MLVIPAESTREHDCLRVVVASVFEVPADAIPWRDVATDWEGAWSAVVAFARARGFHLSWNELADSTPLVEWLDDVFDPPLFWIASVLHASFDDYAHALLFRGRELVLYPPTGKADVPLADLELAGVGVFVAIDPARFVLGRDVEATL